MEKDYAKRVREIKNEILKEIRKILPNGKHEFEDTFFIHYIEGDVAATDVCAAVEVEDGMVSLHAHPYGFESVEKVEAEIVFNYDVYSFIDLLENLKKEIREKKLAKLRKIIVDAGGELTFDGNFIFTGCDEDNWVVSGCELTSLRISDGKIIVGNNFEGNVCENGESFLEISELDRITDYAEKETMSRFALTDEQNAAVDELARAVNRIKESGLKVLIDFNIGELTFVNPNGKDIEIVAKGSKPNAITDMTQIYCCVDYLYSSQSDDIVVV